jgi:hypothetical protein
MPVWFAWFITFNFLNLSFIIFRADSLDGAWKIMNSMFFGELITGERFKQILTHMSGNSQTIIYLSIAFILVLFLKNSTHYKNNFVASKKSLVFTFAILFYSIISLNEISEFLYFNF